MKDNNLETTLRRWFTEMVNRYKWMSIRFEYSETRGVYLVSYSPADRIQGCEEFIEESIDFEDKMNALYGDDAPLFCDEEKYFKLSDNAETVRYINTSVFRVDITTKKRTFNFSGNVPDTIKTNYSLAA